MKIKEKISNKTNKSLKEDIFNEFKIWKTIEVNTKIKTAEDFLSASHYGGFKISNWALNILKNPAFTAAIEETEIDLIKVTVAELGFKEGARCDQIFRRAEKFGYKICPDGLGPQLRLQYQDQPEGEQIFVAMKPIIDSYGFIMMLYLERYSSESGLWLYSSWNNVNDIFSPNSQWVFWRPRN